MFSKTQNKQSKNKTILRKTIHLGLVLYSLNAGVQGYKLINSEAYKSREQVVVHGIELAKELQEDTAFKKMIQAYVSVKQSTNPEFRKHLREYQENLNKAYDTRDEFKTQIKKMYNPMLLF